MLGNLSFYGSPRNKNLNLLVRIKFLNLFLHSSSKKCIGQNKVSLVMGRRTGTHCEDYDGMTYQNMDPSDVEFSKIQNNRKISQNHIQHDSLNQIHDLPLPPPKKINPSFISKCLPLSYKTINNNFFHCFKDFWILS